MKLLLTLTLLLIPSSAMAIGRPEVIAAVPTCPTDFQPLITNLLKDLPSYTNRIALRSRPLAKPATSPKSSPPDAPNSNPYEMTTQRRIQP
ncbi:MAG: hypothetical protein HC860_19865 [Alkalinema sp. RU_4_3]|nr:hypothetical protein [Alkalinema sp. RU_4_3]